MVDAPSKWHKQNNGSLGLSSFKAIRLTIALRSNSPNCTILAWHNDLAPEYRNKHFILDAMCANSTCMQTAPWWSLHAVQSSPWYNLYCAQSPPPSCKLHPSGFNSQRSLHTVKSSVTNLIFLFQFFYCQHEYTINNMLHVAVMKFLISK